MQELIKQVQEACAAVAHNAAGDEYLRGSAVNDHAGGVLAKTRDAIRTLDLSHLSAEPDQGPWAAGKTDDGRVYVESDDFTHDVRLYVDGDFAGKEERMSYAKQIATRLNATPPQPSK